MFNGWYRIALVDYLEPRSPELIRMLEQKWTKTKGGKVTEGQRSSASWQRSLDLRWAVVKFVKDEGDRAAPVIERKPDESGEGKGVNDMLKELRVRNVTNVAPTEKAEDGKSGGVADSGGHDVESQGRAKAEEIVRASVGAGDQLLLGNEK